VYLRRGNDEMTNSSNVVINSEYRAEYVEKDEVIKLNTTGKNSVKLFNKVRRGDEISPIDVNMELVFDNDGNCSIRSFGSDAYKVSGTGKFVENGDTWGGKLRDVIYLNYTYVDDLNNETHKVNDTLVVRDRDVVFEEFNVYQLVP